MFKKNICLVLINTVHLRQHWFRLGGRRGNAVGFGNSSRCCIFHLGSETIPLFIRDKKPHSENEREGLRKQE
jgi:hypothetical protein